jgi:hypothetical protein
MAMRHRKDGNQDAIEERLYKLPVTLVNTTQLGGGAPDLMVVAENHRFVWLEIKVPGEKRRKSQVEFQRKHWRLPIHVVESADDALDVVLKMFSKTR